MGIHHIVMPGEFTDGFSAMVEALQKTIRASSGASSLTLQFSEEVPQSAGIYAIYIDNKLDYIGESGCLRDRVRDLFRTVNHSFRRSLGKKLFGHREGFVAATSKQKFLPQIEVDLTKYYAEHLSILVVPLPFGRKEVEELFVAGGGLRNVRGQRGTKRNGSN